MQPCFRVSLALAAVAAALLLAACSGGSGGAATHASGAAARSPAPVATPTRASGNLILATTTSTQDTGVLDVLVPAFEKESGYTVKTVAVGSGQAIAMGTSGNADVLLVHSPDAEKKMVDAGEGVERALVMHNDFVIVGPASDAAGVKSAKTTAAAMTAIADKRATFISRGDDSGTNALELKLWKSLNIDPSNQSWYQKTGQGMGATLQVTDQKNAYTISDRGTYLSQKKNLGLQILFQGDPALLNVYHVIVVNPAKHANLNAVGARAFAAFIVRPDIQALIAKFGVDRFGQPLFFADAGKPDPTGPSAATAGTTTQPATARALTPAAPPTAAAAR
ncbi:MAG: substrate-binding domain-containing protein [Dehalococcoidia bacterium]|nr:substrate-binding domain-containing protein [Dehalococcoidia bacterium]